MPLHLDYRPQTLDEIIGNDSIKDSIKSILSREDKPRTYLFTGPSGCGKTTFARILANELGCDEDNFYELNISDARGIDSARDIISKMYQKPLSGNIKVYYLDECQEATSNFQDAILKALEDTPPHVVFILATTDPQKLKRTIKTRCTSFEVSLLDRSEMLSLIKRILEDLQIEEFPKEAINEIVSIVQGCPREALILLDSVVDIEEDEKIIEAVKRTVLSESSVKDLCKALLENKSWNVLREILNLLQEQDEEKIRRAILSYMNKVLLSSASERAALIISLFKEPFYTSGKAGLTLACFDGTD